MNWQQGRGVKDSSLDCLRHDVGSTLPKFVFSLRNLFIFCGLTEKFLFIRDGEEWG